MPMSNNLKLQVLLKAVDQATRPFKTIQTASKSLSADIRDTQKHFKKLNHQTSRIEGFRKTNAQLAVTGQELKRAKEEARALAIQFRNTEQPTRAQAQAMEAARKNAAALQLKHNSLRQAVQRQRQELSQAGINTRTLAADERRLKTAISETTAQLNRQREALARVSAQQAKLNAVKQRYQTGKELASNVAGFAATGVGMATTGVLAEAALLKSGYEFSLQNSTLQGVLGLENDDPALTELKRQARQIGDNTAASAGDAAAAQIIIAKAGGDKDAIIATTPTTLNMSLANTRSMEENATLLMSTKSAFGLANQQVAHLGDVISATLNKTASNFDGLRDALTYVAPVAKNAGVSLEQTAAMVGALADSGITASMAGTGSRAVLTRLQAPTGKAYDAIQELGVKTADRRGNMRPVFKILQEMQRSFEKNKLGSAQRAEYMKTIFGEEAASAAAVLVADAANGKLEQLTQTFVRSDGSTERLVNVQQDNLGGDFKQFQSAYEAVGNDLFEQQESTLRRLTQTVTQYVLKLDLWIQKNPKLAKNLLQITSAAIGLVGVMGAIGLAAWPVIQGINTVIAVAASLGTAFSLASSTIMAAVGGLTWPITAAVAVIIAGALLIRKYWQPISSFFSGVVEGLIAAFAPIAKLFAPLKPVFDWLHERLQMTIHWFKQLIQPVQSSKESLESYKNAGITFGRAIADALTLPIQAFNKLRDCIDWTLEKLGLINSQSDGLEEKANTFATGANGYGYSPSGGLLSANYAPVRASNNVAYTDHSTNSYSIGVQVPAGSSPEETKRLVREALEESERQKRANSRSRMNID